jgi:4-hydroxythreonine-4-phosphate dehydrogenase
MIFITQGHEKSIGLEIFLKSYLLLSPKEREQFILVVDQETLFKNIKFLKVPYEVKEDGVKIGKSFLKCNFISTSFKAYPLSTLSLLTAIDKMDYEKDILITQPTSKDQLILDSYPTAGHTDFLRKLFGKNDGSMVFSCKEDNVLLITDHIPLAQVSKEITSELIHNKVVKTIESFKRYFDSFDEVLFAGINPHAGENGILGKEDLVINKVISNLSQLYSNISFKGPYSGDVLTFEKNSTKNQLLVYMYHDQGLSWFKGKNKFLGANITLGLPFLRMSVDHGTAFDLYGKNKAQYLGCYYLLKLALKAQNKILLRYHDEHQPNIDNQSQGS